MTSGKAISRAERGLILIKSALSGILLSDVYSLILNTDDENSSSVFNVHDSEHSDMLNELSDVLTTLMSSDDFTDVVQICEGLSENRSFQQLVTQIKNYYRADLSSSKTAQLWLQFIDQIDILCDHIKAHRVGDFALLVQTLLRMRPVLASSGAFELSNPGFCKLLCNWDYDL